MARAAAMVGFKAAQEGGDINQGRARPPPAGLRLCASTVFSLGKPFGGFVPRPAPGLE